MGLMMAQNHADAIDWMGQAASVQTVLDESILGPERIEVSRVLYGVLVNMVKAKALTIARKVPRGQGL